MKGVVPGDPKPCQVCGNLPPCEHTPPPMSLRFSERQALRLASEGEAVHPDAVVAIVERLGRQRDRIEQLEDAINEHREKFRDKPQAPADVSLWRTVSAPAPTGPSTPSDDEGSR